LFVDLTAHRQLESQLHRAVAERDRLLSEAHRRVKANLQLVSSLINIQLARQADSTLRLFAQDVQNRIRAIALLHDLLLQSSDCSAVNMQPYIRQITVSLAQAYAQQHSATVECRADDIWLDIDAAVRVGLIVNELVVNALKYAFPGQTSGAVSVSLARTGERSALLEVRDSGAGLPPGAESGASQGHGLRLVIDLARNLGSVAHVERRAGTTFQFRLPIPVQPGAAGDADVCGSSGCPGA
jgi:two-component sensor histidine kinase